MVSDTVLAEAECYDVTAAAWGIDQQGLHVHTVATVCRPFVTDCMSSLSNRRTAGAADLVSTRFFGIYRTVMRCDVTIAYLKDQLLKV